MTNTPHRNGSFDEARAELRAKLDDVARAAETCLGLHAERGADDRAVDPEQLVEATKRALYGLREWVNQAERSLERANNIIRDLRCALDAPHYFIDRLKGPPMGGEHVLIPATDQVGFVYRDPECTGGEYLVSVPDLPHYAVFDSSDLKLLVPHYERAMAAAEGNDEQE